MVRFFSSHTLPIPTSPWPAMNQSWGLEWGRPGCQRENSGHTRAPTSTLLPAFPGEAAFSIRHFGNPAQPVTIELLLAPSWIWWGVLKQQLLLGYVEVQEKSVNTGKFICLLCDSWPASTCQMFGAGSDQGCRWLLAGSYYFGGTGHGKDLQFKVDFCAYPVTFPSASCITVTNSPIKFEEVIGYLCWKILIWHSHSSLQDKWAYLTKEGQAASDLS